MLKATAQPSIGETKKNSLIYMYVISINRLSMIFSDLAGAGYVYLLMKLKLTIMLIRSKNMLDALITSA